MVKHSGSAYNIKKPLKPKTSDYNCYGSKQFSKGSQICAKCPVAKKCNKVFPKRYPIKSKFVPSGIRLS